MKKKKYEAPVVKRVKLEIRGAIMSACHSSMIIEPSGEGMVCREITSMCANPLT